MRYHPNWLLVLYVLVLSIVSAGLPCHATASPSPWNETLIKHKWDVIPDNWASLGQPPNGTTINLHIALKANRENALIDAFHEVSNPRHSKYGAHLSREKVAELVAPHPDSLELVFSWLTYNGVPPSSISNTGGGGWLTVTGVPVSRANQLLGASYELYHHAWTNETILRTVSYALPAVLHMRVNTVSPTTAFTSMHLSRQTPLSRSGEDAAQADAASGETADLQSRRRPPPISTYRHYVKPGFLRWLYGMATTPPAAAGQNELGIAGFANKNPSQEDQVLFMQQFRTDASTGASELTVVPVNGGVNNESPPGGRGNLDTQYSLAMTYPTPVIYYTVGKGEILALNFPYPPQDDQYLRWVLYMTNLPTVPQTISIPYYTKEPDLSEGYAYTVCNLFLRLGSRGASVLVPSGDDGVGGPDCKPRSGNTLFYTVFPASCPYVTSVGGTTNFGPEIASRTSGGGFSDFFLRPDYQYDAMDVYLPNLGSEHAGRFNPLNRGVPDISMQSVEYAVVWKGVTSSSSGTNLATNTAAAIIAMLNDFLVSRGKPSLGFLNYWLYEAGLYWEGINDIVTGRNPGCQTEGFGATVGWDPVTGLGTLNYTLLEQHLTKWVLKVENTTRRTFTTLHELYLPLVTGTDRTKDSGDEGGIRELEYIIP